MRPKDVLTLLKIIDLSSQSPAYSNITAAAHAALMNATMPVLPESEEEEGEEEQPNPTRQPTPSVPRRTS